MEVRNTYYPIDSLIKLNDYNGVVELDNFNVNGFSNCGSIIRNFEKNPLMTIIADQSTYPISEFLSDEMA